MDASFDFLAEGETLTVTYDVTVNDNDHAASTRPVTITSPAPTTHRWRSPTATGARSSRPAMTSTATSCPATPRRGDVLTNDTDVDRATPRCRPRRRRPATGVLSGCVGAAISGIYGTLMLTADGSWSYALDNDDPDTDALAQGAQPTTSSPTPSPTTTAPPRRDADHRHHRHQRRAGRQRGAGCCDRSNAGVRSPRGRQPGQHADGRPRYRRQRADQRFRRRHRRQQDRAGRRQRNEAGPLTAMSQPKSPVTTAR